MTVDLEAGILNKRITIQERTETPDGEGGFTESWADVGTYWAEVRPLSAKQVYEYASLNVRATHRVKVRGSVPVEENNRIVYRTREFEILTVEDELEHDVVKWITCEEKRN